MEGMISKVMAIKEYFSTEENQVTSDELLALRKDPAAYDELAGDAAKALGKELKPA